MGQSRIIWVVMVALFLLIGGIAVAVGKKKGGTAAQGGRAVLVPTSDRARTIVVPPCATGVAVTERNAEQQIGTTGATRISVPRGTGARVVVVPRRPARRGGGARGRGPALPGEDGREPPVGGVRARARGEDPGEGRQGGAQSGRAGP